MDKRLDLYDMARSSKEQVEKPEVVPVKSTPVDVIAFETELATFLTTLEESCTAFFNRRMDFAEQIADTGPTDSFFKLGAMIGGQVSGMDQINKAWYEEEFPIYERWLDAATDAASVVVLVADRIMNHIQSLSDESDRRKYDPLVQVIVSARQKLKACSAMPTRDNRFESVSRNNDLCEEKIRAFTDFVSKYTQILKKAIQEIMPK